MVENTRPPDLAKQADGLAEVAQAAVDLGLLDLGQRLVLQRGGLLLLLLQLVPLVGGGLRWKPRGKWGNRKATTTMNDDKGRWTRLRCAIGHNEERTTKRTTMDKSM